MRLKDLLAQDLMHYANADNNAVLSEESIRLLIDVYKANGKLVNPRLVKYPDVIKLFHQLHHKKCATHEQWIVESGERGKLRQRENDSIHYTAFDIWSDADGKLIVLIADHYHGVKYNSFLDAYSKIDLPRLHFVVCGGSLYQTDSTHCAVFALSHLLLTARDAELPAKLVQIAQSSSEKVTRFPWFDLMPAYNLNTQSFTALTKYVDYVKQVENLPPETASHILSTSAFDIHLAKGLIANSEQKLQNRRIEQVTTEYAHDAVQSLEHYSEESLIALCYQEHYPRVAELLRKALKTSRDISDSLQAGQVPVNGHPLFDLLFYNQPALNILDVSQLPVSLKNAANNENFYALLNNQSLLILMQINVLDPQQLFNAITKTDGVLRSIDGAQISLFLKNIAVLDYIVDHWKENNYILAFSQNIIGLLGTKNAATLLGYPAIRKLYFSGEVDNQYLGSIRVDKFKKTPIANECRKFDLDQFITKTPTGVAEGMQVLSPINASEILSKTIGFFAVDNDHAKSAVKPAVTQDKTNNNCNDVQGFNNTNNSEDR